jgi:hypothetical protein
MGGHVNCVNERIEAQPHARFEDKDLEQSRDGHPRPDTRHTRHPCHPRRRLRRHLCLRPLRTKHGTTLEVGGVCAVCERPQQ